MSNTSNPYTFAAPATSKAQSMANPALDLFALLNMKEIRRSLGALKASKKKRKAFATKYGLSSISPTVYDSGSYVWGDRHVVQFLVDYGVLLGSEDHVDTRAVPTALPCEVEVAGTTGFMTLHSGSPAIDQLNAAIMRGTHATVSNTRDTARFLLSEQETRDIQLSPYVHFGLPADAASMAVAFGDARRIASQHLSAQTPSQTPHDPQAQNAGKGGSGKTKPTDPLGGFPFDVAYKVSEALQQSVQRGEADESENLLPRRFERWAYIYHVLKHHGMGARNAFHLGYHVTMVETLPDDSRNHVETVFSAAVGHNLAPMSDLLDGTAIQTYTKAMANTLGEVVRSEIALVAMLIDARVPVWVWGPKGGGKTYGTLQALRFLGYADPIRVQGTRQTETPDLFGGVGLTVENGASKTTHEDGALTIAARANRAVVLDEWDRMTDAVRHECHALLDGSRAITIKQTAEVLPFDAPLVATCNTAGLAENPAYTDAGVTDASTRDRFAFVSVGAMTKTDMKAVIEFSLGQKLPGLTGLTTVK